MAFPAISTGVYGFPMEPACKIAIATVKLPRTSDFRLFWAKCIRFIH
ncbi:macro domain-containing protein [Aulosira sp. FACHB-615]|nr:macro domain-containing protein [Aulosira sp. FACHB-615]